MGRPPYFYHPRMLAYDFGPRHPFRPERLSLCMELLCCYGIETADPGSGSLANASRVHSQDYLAALRDSDDLVRAGVGLSPDEVRRAGRHGLMTSDNPGFAGMWQASLDFIGGTVRAAEFVRDGALRALTLAGGLHHASRDRASGFCLLNDPAIAISILLERFERVAYIDIDLHHGDGVQWIWYDDPRVLTCSIHESGRTLFPGTGFVEETGSAYTSLNIPLEAGTTGDVWLDAFQRIVPRSIEKFDPSAIVLQMGSDPHFFDPLGNLQVSAQEWLESVRIVDSFGLPLVACGGGGYNMSSVVRMWSAAILSLSGVEFDDKLTDEFARRFGTDTFSDPLPPGPSAIGRAEADRVIAWFDDVFFPRMPGPW